jgi:NAD(P)-dependent dehydrogenase (short-subunit alcohol dehydrogenase family)
LPSLTGKIVIISGAKGGLGTWVTQAFLEAEATVIGISRSISAADFAGPNFHALPAQVSNLESAQHAIGNVVEKHGTIDCLVHLVGGFSGGQTVAETAGSTLKQMLELNLCSAFNLMHAVIPVMRAAGSGRIIATGSRSAVEPAPGAGAYAASKAALVSLVRTVAAENTDRAITANIVLPGTMDTPANRDAMPGSDFSKWVRPRDVASLMVYLASREAAGINGASIPVYGTD